MLRLSGLQLPLNHSDVALRAAIVSRLHILDEELQDFSLFKRSHDARKKNNIRLIYQIDVDLTAAAEQQVLEQLALKQHPHQASIRPSPNSQYQFVAEAESNFPCKQQQRPIIIGFGPCGILAALVLAQMGLKPIVLERGQAVRQRTKDTWQLWRDGKLNTESNVQYGEGGAGTFSDGKLYSQVKDKRHLGRKVLTEFVKAGAPEEILYINKPHIGTFKLVSMVENMREQIIALGGEIQFGAKVEMLHREVNNSDKMQNNEHNQEHAQVTGLTVTTRLEDGSSHTKTLHSRHIVLAIGHSARDSFQMLLEQGVYLEAKPFSIGFRIEHPQSLIDKAMFGKQAGHPILGAADYKLVHHCKNGRSVYSFCMCPGGTVVAATSEQGCLVTNGMSQYSRNERNANSAIVVGIEPSLDYPEHPLAGIDLQRQLEAQAYQLGGQNYHAPAQLLGDFLTGSPSKQLGKVKPSYTPGVTLGDLSQALPEFAVEAIREAIPEFDKKIKGFAMPDAVLTAVETRSSSPVCIKRGKDLQSINTQGLYPAGEGAGYAGGILSAAIDGIKIAEALALNLLSDKTVN